MKIRSRALVLLLGAAIVLPAAHQVQPGHVPLYFEPNEGQAHASVQFLSRGVYLGPAKLAIHTGEGKPVVMTLVGARPSVQAEGLDLQPDITSYFLGNDPKKWRSGVPHYAKVRYRGVYPGIDVVYYGNAEGQLEYDFVVAPGADPVRIEIAYNKPVYKDSNGDLLVAGVRQKKPSVYQGRRAIAASYRIVAGNHVRLAIAEYDRSQTLAVDPVLQYSTYLGGPVFEVGTGIQVDSKGFMYVSMFERAPFSPDLNPFQQVVGGSYAAFVTKFAPDGKSIVYYAYVGGTGDTHAEALAIDSAGNAYVTGQTQAFDFPTKNAVQAQFGGGFDDAYAVKISADGRSILYATYLGGSAEEDATAIGVNGRGEAYIAGYTYSNDYPVLNALQSRKSNGADAFISRLSADGRNLLSSTFIGGDYLDGIHGLALDSSGFVYVTGVTGSDDFPIKNPLQPALGAPAGFTSNAFVAKLTPTMDAFVYSTYLGGSGYANGWSIAIDSSGSAAICGVAAVGFPTRNASQPLYGGGLVDIFVAKLTADGSSLVFSTYLGGGDADYQSASTLALDADGNIYTTGFTYSNDFPLKQSLQSFIGATGGYRTDAFVAKFSPMGTLLYSTLIGGHGDDRGTSIAVDSNRTVYVTGVTYSDDFPLVNPFQKTYGGAGDVFVIKLAPDIAPTSPFSPTPGTAQFTFIVGGPTPTPQRISIPTGGAFTIAASSAAWLSVSPQAGMAPSVLSIQANPIGLAPQLYSASIQIVPTSGSSFELPVILNVLAAAPVVTSISPSNVPLNSAGTSFTISGSGFTAASSTTVL